MVNVDAIKLVQEMDVMQDKEQDLVVDNIVNKQMFVVVGQQMKMIVILMK